MCRLFGWAADHDVTAGGLLGDDVARLIDLSRQHDDGWGVATHSSEGLSLVREDVPAFQSARFTERTDDMVGQTGIVHLRWATGRLARCIENTHPFVRGEVAFMHNGSLPVTDALRSTVDADLAASIEGTTDSEWYFMALLSARRRTSSVAEAAAAVLDTLAGERWPSLNMMWAEPDHLHVLCAHQPAFKPSAQPDNYYWLQYRQNADAVTAWSSGVRDEVGEPLPNRSLLAVRASTGELELQSL
jgi:predicted glutamine amidotransferase